MSIDFARFCFPYYFAGAGWCGRVVSWSRGLVPSPYLFAVPALPYPPARARQLAPVGPFASASPRSHPHGSSRGNVGGGGESVG